jgi:bifunctional non-homologous end joining protein LigD
LRHGPRVKPDAVLYAFGLLELDGEDLRAMPLEIRKRKLGGLLARAGLQLCEHLRGDGAEIFLHACQLGCEGIVRKRRLALRRRPHRPLDQDKNPAAPAVQREADEDWSKRR